MRKWDIVRIIREEFEVVADTKEEALLTVDDPHTVKIIRESISEQKT